MKYNFILVAIIFITPLVLGKLEHSAKSKRSFFEFIKSSKNEDEDTQCTKTPDTTGQCAYGYYDEEKEEMYSRFNHCPEEKYCIDVIVPEHEYKCKVIPKFYGEACESDSECATNKCADKKCVRKNIGDICRNDKECGLTEYCHYNEAEEEPTSGVCKTYITVEGAACSYYDLCHPQYECDYMENKCKVRGKKKVGDEAEEDYECASFMVKNDHCSDEYDKTDPSDMESEKIAKAFKNIDWSDKNLKVSDYYGYNFGSKANLEINEEFQFPECVEEFGKEYCECTNKISTENYIGHILWDSAQKGDSLPDNLIKEILQGSHSSSIFIKLSLYLVISLLALI